MAHFSTSLYYPTIIECFEILYFFLTLSLSNGIKKDSAIKTNTNYIQKNTESKK